MSNLAFILLILSIFGTERAACELGGKDECAKLTRRFNKIGCSDESTLSSKQKRQCSKIADNIADNDCQQDDSGVTSTCSFDFGTGSCYPEEFYSMSQETCVRDCAPEALQDEFFAFNCSRPALGENESWLSQDEHVDQSDVCKARCLANPKCESFTFEWKGTCTLYTKMSENAFIDVHPGGIDATYYKRHCA